jgi:hypothetical protein
MGGPASGLYQMRGFDIGSGAFQSATTAWVNLQIKSKYKMMHTAINSILEKRYQD